MSPSFIEVHLQGRAHKHFLLGVLFAVLFSPMALAALMGLFSHSDRSRAAIRLLVFGSLWLASVSVAVAGQWSWKHWDRAADWLHLARYGPPGDVAAAIDDELADYDKVARIGRPVRSFRVAHWQGKGLRSSRVMVTHSWLIHVWGAGDQRVSVQRLADLVVVSRADATRAGACGQVTPVASAVLIDRHGFRLEVTAGPDAIAQVLALVMARVPWALNHFDAATQRAWAENREAIIAEVQRVRERSV